MDPGDVVCSGICKGSYFPKYRGESTCADNKQELSQQFLKFFVTRSLPVQGIYNGCIITKYINHSSPPGMTPKPGADQDDPKLFEVNRGLSVL